MEWSGEDYRVYCSHLAHEVSSLATSSEGLHADLDVRVLVPAAGGSGLNGNDGEALAEDTLLVVFGLRVEDIHAHHGDDAGLDAGGGELRAKNEATR